MINKVNELFGIKLSKEGKKKVNNWLLDEFETMYYAQKELDSDDALMDFINDMLIQENVRLNDLCMYNYDSPKEPKKTTKKEVKKEVKQNHFKYCPYCGECIDFN